MLRYLKLSVANVKDKSATAAMNSYNKGGTQKLVGRNRVIVSNLRDLPIEVKACLGLRVAPQGWVLLRGGVLSVRWEGPLSLDGQDMMAVHLQQHQLEDSCLAGETLTWPGYVPGHVKDEEMTPAWRKIAKVTAEASILFARALDIAHSSGLQCKLQCP